MISVNKNGLIFKLAVSIAFAALLVSFIAAQVFYRFTYFHESETITTQVKNLYKTVSATAAIAAYLDDEGLATEVVNGLSTNNSVAAAAFINDKLDIKSSQEFDFDNALSFPMYSPFQPDKVVGHVYLIANQNYIERQARNIAIDNVKALTALSVIATLATIFITFFLITKPMTEVAARLNNISPGQKSRIKLPSFHSGSELGMLVRDVNRILDKTTEHLGVERALRSELQGHEQRLRMLFENSTSPIVLMEPTGSILLYNPAFQRLLEQLDVKLVRNFGPLLSDLFEEPAAIQKTVKLAFANGEAASGEFKLLTLDQSKEIWVQAVFTSNLSDEHKEYYHVTLFDVSKRIKELDELNQQAHYDQLTQLMNRRGLESQLDRLVRKQQRFALMMMDLNGFKPINDEYGHDAGDEILIFIAKELKGAIRKDDIVARWGGDEFVVLMKDISKDQVTKLSQVFQSKISQSYYLRSYDTNVSVSASMGVAFYPDDELDIQALLRLADKAMYWSKANNYKQPNCLQIANEIQHHVSENA